MKQLFDYCDTQSDFAKNTVSRGRFISILENDPKAIAILRNSENLWPFLKVTAFKDAFRIFGAESAQMHYVDLEDATVKYLLFRRKLRRVFNMIDDDDSDLISTEEIVSAIQVSAREGEREGGRELGTEGRSEGVIEGGRESGRDGRFSTTLER